MITICDTGPIVAYLNRNDPYHSWAVALMKQVLPPMLTCEPVLGFENEGQPPNSPCPKKMGRGRDIARATPPAQIRASGITAHGSYLGYSALKRCSG